ncbi:MAG: methylthioribulose 1-phosphate dehydratase [Cyanobacteria bacterium Co-bin8]|nr:methylthioribulose 1-phosphate dehydratase [Cyanobacteria bacterium Co-bin8]
MLHSPDQREALSWVIKEIHGKGWATGTGGNFSAVDSREPLALLMAPSGVDKGMVTPADLIRVNQQGAVIEGSGKASAETPLHLAIVEATGAGAVLHTHSVFNTLLSVVYAAQGAVPLAGYEMLKGLEGITTHDTTVQIPVLPNSQDMQQLSQEIRPILQQNPHSHGVLLSGHGLYTWGNTLFQARRHLEILEFLFELTYRKLTLPAM